MGAVSVSNHLAQLFTQPFIQAQIKSKKTSKLRVTSPCLGNSPVTSEFLAQMARNTENVTIWRRRRDIWVPESAKISNTMCKYYTNPTVIIPSRHVQLYIW